MVTMNVHEDWLRSMMADRGIKSFQELAQRTAEIGKPISYVTIYRLANNDNWTRKTVEAICEALDCDPRDFISFNRKEIEHYVQHETAVYESTSV